MADINPTLPKIKLNINELNMPEKKKKIANE